VLSDGRPEKTPVERGLSDGNFTELVQGKIAPGDLVVVDEVVGEERSASAAPAGAARPHFHQ
jgi:hypothetical protein